MPPTPWKRTRCNRLPDRFAVRIGFRKGVPQGAPFLFGACIAGTGRPGSTSQVLAPRSPRLRSIVSPHFRAIQSRFRAAPGWLESAGGVSRVASRGWPFACGPAATCAAAGPEPRRALSANSGGAADHAAVATRQGRHGKATCAFTRPAMQRNSGFHGSQTRHPDIVVASIASQSRVPRIISGQLRNACDDEKTFDVETSRYVQAGSSPKKMARHGVPHAAPERTRMAGRVRPRR